MKFLQSWRVRKPADDNESVYISEKFGVRTLHIGSDTVQSSMRIARPNDLEVSYTRSMMAFLLFNPTPANVLMVGLGGGSLAKFIYHQLPQTRTVAIEVNRRSSTSRASISACRPTMTGSKLSSRTALLICRTTSSLPM